MDNFIRLLILLSDFSFICKFTFVNSDAIHNHVSGGWSSIVVPIPASTDSASKDQLSNWSKNRTIFTAHSRATNLQGIPVPSLTASQAVNSGHSSGHILLQDFFLAEKIASFNRERVPERSTHAKGAGAHGNFIVTDDVSKFTKAKFLKGVGKKTRVFVRFSSSSGEHGSADTLVDPNGFATKFYTEDGNYDLVGSNIESFPIRDPMLFPDMMRSRKRNPQTNLRDENMFFDWLSLRPESTLHTLHLFSDIGRPRSYRSMDGFGVHAFKCVNEHNEVVFCKFVWKTLQPQLPFTHKESTEKAGTDPDLKTQDLFDAIEDGNFPKWALFLQVMTVQEAKAYPHNPFDITRTWRGVPLLHVGTMVLDKNPDNFFAEVEQSAFSPANLVPGIEPSPDKILAGRLFAYPDAQRYRVGVNYPQLPINRPDSPVNSYQRDGRACFGHNGGGSPNYFPNSFGGSIVDVEQAHQISFAVQGVVDRFDVPEDEHEEARIFLAHDLDPAQRERLIDSIAVKLQNAKLELRERTLRNIFYPISKEFGDAIRIATEKYIIESTHENNMKNGILVHKVAVGKIEVSHAVSQKVALV